MAHEIAHQWFGDCATETRWEHLWLSEGFATYMTHCYLENKYGADTLKKGMQKDRSTLIAYEKVRLTSVVDTTVGRDYMQLLNPNSYEKGGWVLHMLRRRLGDDLFWKGISTYYTTAMSQQERQQRRLRKDHRNRQQPGPPYLLSAMALHARPSPCPYQLEI